MTSATGGVTALPYWRDLLPLAAEGPVIRYERHGAAVRLGQLLAGAPGPDTAVALLQRFLLSRQARSDRPDPLVTEAVRRLMPWQPVEISRLTTQLAISTS